MVIVRWSMTLVLVLALVAGGTSAGRAQDESAYEPSSLYGDAGPTTSEDTERWWGAVGAAVCGAELALIRANPVVGMNPYALAAGLSGCLLAAIDVASTK
jgi:hypothetical protein